MITVWGKLDPLFFRFMRIFCPHFFSKIGDMQILPSKATLSANYRMLKCTIHLTARVRGPGIYVKRHSTSGTTLVDVVAYYVYTWRQ